MKSIRIRTKIPGPESLRMAARKEKYVASPVGTLSPFYIAKGSGAVVEDVDGNQFLDFTGGWGCLVVGYSPPSLLKAAKEQMENYIHSDFTATPYEPWVKCAEMLVKRAPGRFEKQVIFFNGGAEAVENAVKIARGATGRRGVVVFEKAFHGRSLLTMTMTHRAMPYKHIYGTAPDVHRLPYPDAHFNRYGARDFERLLLNAISPEEAACVVIEPIQGEGGFNIPPKGFLEEIRRVTKKYGILFVADEVQSGFGRTGKFFAVENWNLVPDLIVLGKSIAAGFPLSAVVGNKKYFDKLPLGSIGSTFGGNPVALRASIEVMRIIDREKLLARAVKLGRIINRRFRKMMKKCPGIKEVRGIGSMQAIEFIKDEKTWQPDTQTCQKVIARALKNGVILAGAGLNRNVIRLLIPLVITDEQLNEGLDVVEEAVKFVSNRK